MMYKDLKALLHWLAEGGHLSENDCGAGVAFPGSSSALVSQDILMRLLTFEFQEKRTKNRVIVVSTLHWFEPKWI